MRSRPVVAILAAALFLPATTVAGVPGSGSAHREDRPQAGIELANQDEHRSRAGEARERAEDAARERGNDSPGVEDDDALKAPAPSNLSNQIEDLGNFVDKPKGKETTVPEEEYRFDEPCRVSPAGGWMQPVQGVWQDDPVFPKVEWGGKPLRNPVLHEGKRPGWYDAKLPMVAGRDTVLMGVEKYRNKSGVVAAGTHDELVIQGVSNCLGRVGVKVKFRLSDSNGWHDLYTTDVIGFAPLEGKPTFHPRKFKVEVPAKHGFPPQDVGPFRIAPGSYYLSAELLKENGDPTGLSVVVTGEAVTMHPPVVQFVPVMLSDRTGSKEDVIAFESYVRDLAEASRKFIPDYFPLPPDGLPTFARPVINYSDLRSKDENLFPAYAAMILKERLVRQLSVAAALGGADRVVAVVRGDKPSAGTGYVSEYDRVSKGSVGVALSTKVIVVSMRVDDSTVHKEGSEPVPQPGSMGHFEAVTLPYPRRPREPGEPISLVSPDKVTSDIVDTVAHELAHSLPDHVWSGNADARHNMLQSCGINYHNKKQLRAYGERLVIGGYSSERRREDGKMPILGPSTYDETWITQCTYGHLIGAMLKKPDPPLLLVPVGVSRAGGAPAAVLSPLYEQMGTADVVAGSTRGWAVTMRDSSGKILATYPFEPGWDRADEGKRDDAFVLLHVPQDEKAALLEITHAGKTLASRRIASAPPSLEVSAPTKTGDATAHVSWRATSAGGDRIVASVFYSTDGGRLFNDQVFEQEVTEADVALDPAAGSHVIKVIVSDGSRSSEKLVSVAAN